MKNMDTTLETNHCICLMVEVRVIFGAMLKTLCGLLCSCCCPCEQLHKRKGVCREMYTGGGGAGGPGVDADVSCG